MHTQRSKCVSSWQRKMGRKPWTRRWYNAAAHCGDHSVFQPLTLEGQLFQLYCQIVRGKPTKKNVTLSAGWALCLPVTLPVDIHVKRTLRVTPIGLLAKGYESVCYRGSVCYLFCYCQSSRRESVLHNHPPFFLVLNHLHCENVQHFDPLRLPLLSVYVPLVRCHSKYGLGWGKRASPEIYFKSLTQFITPIIVSHPTLPPWVLLQVPAQVKYLCLQSLYSIRSEKFQGFISVCGNYANYDRF